MEIVYYFHINDLNGFPVMAIHFEKNKQILITLSKH
jgi:hypothetical protein